MKYYKFNRDRSIKGLFKYKKSWRKIEYNARRNKLRVLDSFYFENQAWGALHKAWKGYVIAKNKDEFDRLEYYASVIRKLQKELGLEISSFPDLGLMVPEAIDDDECKANEEMTEEEIFEELEKQDREFSDNYPTC